MRYSLREETFKGEDVKAAYKANKDPGACRDFRSKPPTDEEKEIALISRNNFVNNGTHKRQFVPKMMILTLQSQLALRIPPTAAPCLNRKRRKWVRGLQKKSAQIQTVEMSFFFFISFSSVFFSVLIILKTTKLHWSTVFCYCH